MVLILLDVPLAGEMLLPPRHLFTGRPRRRAGGAEAGCSIGQRNSYIILEERDYRVPPGSGHNIFYRPAKFTNLTPLVIEALYCTGR